MIKGMFKLILLILLFGFILISPKTRYLVGITLKEISSFLFWTVKYEDREKWIIDKLPENKQMVLFSATMPIEIRNIAKKYLNEPAEILIKSVKKETQLITQRYINVQRHHKLDALKRILELNNEGVIILLGQNYLLLQ